MANTQVTVAARLLGETWEGAMIVDGKFQRALIGAPGQLLEDVVEFHINQFLRVRRNEGTEVAITIAITEPDAVS